MIFSENNLYGWGASNLDMPRVVFKSHRYRTRKSGKLVFGGSEPIAVCRWSASRISRIFLHDNPWGQTLLVAVFSILVIAYFFMLNSTLTLDQTPAPARPVKIVVSMQKQEPRPPIIPEEKQPEVIRPIEPVPVTAGKELPTVIVEKPKEITPAVPKKLPPVEIKKPAQVMRKAPESKPVTAAAPVLETQPEPKSIAITPPTTVKRRYTSDNTAKKTPPAPVTRTAELIAQAPQQHNQDRPVQIRKNYTPQHTKNSIGAPQQNTSSNLNMQYQPDIGTPQINPKSKIAARRYVSKTNALLPAVKTPPLKADGQIEFTGSQPGGFQQRTV